MLVSDQRISLISAIETSQQYYTPRTKVQLGGVHTIILWQYLHLDTNVQAVTGCSADSVYKSAQCP